MLGYTNVAFLITSNGHSYYSLVLINSKDFLTSAAY